ncbi:MAG TPA: hypothetical protein VNX68_06830 [Nitrosopumilaceae archaeon]|jgi:hypothetical protein|nr:hypothetical protein [Nitrosopumilaceae archaeon]
MSQTVENSYMPMPEQLSSIDFTVIDNRLKILAEDAIANPTQEARQYFYSLLLQKAWLVHGRVILVQLVNKWSTKPAPLLDDSFEQLKVPPQKLISETWRRFGQEGRILNLANYARKRWTIRQTLDLLNLMHQPNFTYRERDRAIAKLNQEIGQIK